MLVARELYHLKLRHLMPLISLHVNLSLPKPSPNHSISKPHYSSSSSSTSSSYSSSMSSFRSDASIDPNPSPNLPICLGCGVFMQASDHNLPGFFTKPSPKSPNYKLSLHPTPIAHEPQISSSLKSGLLTLDNDTLNSPFPDKPLVCARCHSLRHYGKVKHPKAENLLPDFDFDHTIARRLVTAAGTRSVVLMVVDVVDFDGSFSRKVARLVSSTIEENSVAWKQGKPGNVPRVVLVVTKIDLLPPSLSPTWIEHWARQRAHESGANKLTSVHFVSAVRGWGVKDLIDDVRELAGARGHTWVVGAQNAGKSTLINAMGRQVGGKVVQLTEAPVPGTTLGIIKVDGILSGNAKLFDTPGLLHPHQITTRLTSEEQKLVQISKELKPRTYRLKAGHSIHIGGLVRLDIEKTSVNTIYVTVWASLLLPLHMGRTENSSMMVESHFGRQLQPPIGEKRVAELGRWARREFSVSGNSWDVSSLDVAAAGLGWFAIGLKGEALLGVWTYDGVDILLRNPLIPQRAKIFEVTGFTVSKIVSRADKALNKLQKEKKENEHTEMRSPSTEALELTCSMETSA